MRRRLIPSILVLVALSLLVMPCTSAYAAEWKKTVVFQGVHTNTAVGGDFSGDGLPDVICTSGGRTRLLVCLLYTSDAADE